jgi:hypothetical protein
MYQLLHVIDDPKFIGMCRSTFDIENVNNIFVSPTEWDVSKNDVDVIFIHYLSEKCTDKILANEFTVPLVWFFWGADAFNLGKFYNKFLLNKTRKLRNNLAWENGMSSGMKTYFKTMIPGLIDHTSYGKKTLRVIERFDRVVPVMPLDTNQVSDAYDLNINSFHLNYVNPVLSEAPTLVNGNNILVGNSASFTNNHLEIIDLLSKFDLSDRKVIIPLNYGDSKYGSKIQEYATTRLGPQVETLKDFLAFDDYQRLIKGCNVVIMNHSRQQALGNIIQALYNGAKVVLRTESTVFDYLSDKGFVIEDVNHLSLDGLSQESQLHNSNLCQAVFGKENQQNKVKNLLEQLIE